MPYSAEQQRRYSTAMKVAGIVSAAIGTVFVLGVGWVAFVLSQGF